MSIIPGLGPTAMHIPYDDFKGDTCLSKFLHRLFKSGLRDAIKIYSECMKGHIRNTYNIENYILNMKLLKKDKEGKQPSVRQQVRAQKKELKVKAKQIKIQAKQAKIAKKMVKKQAKMEKKGIKISEVKKPQFKRHITALPFVGSKMIMGFATFLSAGAVYAYTSDHSLYIAGIFGGVAIGLYVLSSAPYARSVGRTNSTLASAVSALDKIDAAIGSQQELIQQIITSIEGAMQKQGYVEIENLKQKVNDLQACVQTQKKSVDEAKPEIENKKPDANSPTNHVVK